jgi:hypothetical protein
MIASAEVVGHMQSVSIIPVAPLPATQAPTTAVAQAGADFAGLLVEAAPILPVAAAPLPNNADVSVTADDGAVEGPLPSDDTSDELADDRSDLVPPGTAALLPAPGKGDVPATFALSLTVAAAVPVAAGEDAAPAPTTHWPTTHLPAAQLAMAMVDGNGPSSRPVPTAPDKAQAAFATEAVRATGGPDDDPKVAEHAPTRSVPGVRRAETPVQPASAAINPATPMAERAGGASSGPLLPIPSPDRPSGPLIAQSVRILAPEPIERPIPADDVPQMPQPPSGRLIPVDGRVRAAETPLTRLDGRGVVSGNPPLAAGDSISPDASPAGQSSVGYTGDPPITPAALPDRPALADPALIPPIGLTPLAEPEHRMVRSPITDHSVPASVPAVTLRDLPQMVAVTLRETPDRQVELRLDPPELGAVRFGIDSQATGLVVTIIAERPDTADLMRRHAEQFLADLRHAGFQGASLQFGSSGNPNGQGTDRSTTPPPTANPITSPAFPPTAQPRPAAAGGLNLRL